MLEDVIKWQSCES